MIPVRDRKFPDTPLSEFAFRTHDKVRYADTDRQGHVNNAVFSTYLETARVEFLMDPKNPATDPGCVFVIAGIQMDLLQQIFWPGTVDIGLSVTRIGTSSVTFSQAVFQNGKVVARAETVVVQLEEGTSRSRPLSEGLRRKLQEFWRNPISE